jgi:hypothetical protein
MHPACVVSAVAQAQIATPSELARAVTRPDALTDAFVLSVDDHLTVVGVPVPATTTATSCCCKPGMSVTLAGITVTEVTDHTMSVVLPEIPLASRAVAVMTDEPALIAVTRPPDETVATEAVPDVQATEEEDVKSCDAPLWNVPVAVSCVVAPTNMVALGEVTAMLSSSDPGGAGAQHTFSLLHPPRNSAARTTTPRSLAPGSWLQGYRRVLSSTGAAAFEAPLRECIDSPPTAMRNHPAGGRGRKPSPESDDEWGRAGHTDTTTLSRNSAEHKPGIRRPELAPP